MPRPSLRDPHALRPRDWCAQKHKRAGEGERRQTQRFDLRLSLRYRVEGHCGSGEVLNISSGGVLFAVDQQVPSAGEMELSIAWPAMLNNSVALNLVAVGPIVRTEAERVAVKIHRYEFRTAKASLAKSEPALPPGPPVRVAPLQAAAGLRWG